MLFVSKNGETRWLTSWEYNAMRILSELRKIASEHGDEVQPINYTVTIINRAEIDEKRDAQERLDWLEARIRLNEGVTDKLRAAAEKYRQIVNSPLTEPALEVPAASWITFRHAGNYISFQMDENPFFEFLYCSTPIVNGKISRDVCLDELPKDWLIDDLLKKHCPDALIHEAAESIYDLLINAPNGVKRLDYVKKMVPNTYNDGYHYEKVLEKEQWKELDF